MSYTPLSFLLISLVSSVYLEQKLDSTMTMGWDIDTSNQTIQITLKCKLTLGYCSVGLSRTMTNCDMFAALSDGNSVTISDYWGVSHSTPKTDVASGGTTDYFYVSGGVNSTGINVVLTRKLNTGDKFDQKISPDIHSQLCWAYRGGKAGWNEHSNYDSATFSWATTAANMYFQQANDKQDHGIAMSAAWGLFAVLGIAVARYFKHCWWWWYVHFVFLSATSFLTIGSSTLTYKGDQYSYENISIETLTHSRFGMFLSSLVGSQIVFGLLTSYFKLFTKNTNATVLLSKAHKAVGYCLFAVGLYNCYVGWDIYGGMGMAVVALGVLIAVLFFAVLETNQLCCRNRLTHPDRSLPEITHFKAMGMIKEGKELMFADELVVNVAHFKRSHPGGTFLIRECIGEDAGKYMAGCSSYDTQLRPYEHSAKAFSMLKSLAIGRIPYPDNYMISIRDTKSVLMEFFVKKKIELNGHTNLLFLKSDDWEMHHTCESPAWLGKHFMFVYRKRCKYVKRYYSAIFVDLFKWTKELGLVSKRKGKNSKGSVKIIFKLYPGGKMTNYLNNLQVLETVMIKGPLGPGLMLQELRGKYLALAGGTGLVPFLDLVYKAWKTFGDKCEFFNLTLFVFFRAWSDGFALEILEKMNEKCEWLDLRIVSDKVGNKKEVGGEIGEKVKQGMNLVWICGPSGFNRSYCELVVESGLDRSRIILM